MSISPVLLRELQTCPVMHCMCIPIWWCLETMWNIKRFLFPFHVEACFYILWIVPITGFGIINQYSYIKTSEKVKSGFLSYRLRRVKYTVETKYYEMSLLFCKAHYFPGNMDPKCKMKISHQKTHFQLSWCIKREYTISSCCKGSSLLSSPCTTLNANSSKLFSWQPDASSVWMAVFSGKIYMDVGFALVDVSRPFEPSLVPCEPVLLGSLQICVYSLLASAIFLLLWVSSFLVCGIWLLVYGSCRLICAMWLLVWESLLFVCVIWLFGWSCLLVGYSFWLVSVTFLLLWEICWCFFSAQDLLLVLEISQCLSSLALFQAVSDFSLKTKQNSEFQEILNYCWQDKPVV